MADIRFIKFATNTLYENKKASVKESDIVFVADVRKIIVNGVSYGVDEGLSTEVTNLKTALEALQKIKHFGGISVGGETWQPATDGASLAIEGTGGTSVTVNSGKLTINSKDYTADIADAKKAGTDAATVANSKVASVAATENAGIAITGTATAPTVGIMLDPTPGNVTLTLGEAGLKANVTIPEDAVKGVAANDKVIALNSTKQLTSTLGLTYATASKKIQLTGIGNAVIAEIDATAFVKDGMISKEATSYDPETKKLTIGFNTDAGIDAFDVDLQDLVDAYDGTNLKLTTASGFAANTILDTAIKSLKDGVDAAKVTSFGGKSGAITVDTVGTAAANTNAVKFTVDAAGKLTAVVNGLGTAAYADKSAIDTAISAAKKAGDDAAAAVNTVKATADSALQTIGKGTDGSYVTTTVSAKSGTTQNVSVALSFHDVSTATSTADGVAKANDVKTYVDDCLKWIEL